MGDERLTTGQLSSILRAMYDQGRRQDEAVAMIILFGIKHADHIQTGHGGNKRQIREGAGLGSSYDVEINKGIQLARYVVVK